jgi:hypothetical protein
VSLVPRRLAGLLGRDHVYMHNFHFLWLFLLQMSKKAIPSAGLVRRHLSVPAVKTRLLRGRLKLRESLSPHFTTAARGMVQ